ncbi:MAG: hypothetical protein HXY40_12125 [Chloroflexi bacterium]|nr:hypothetical protein [Chloroflexota bacterium]
MILLSGVGCQPTLASEAQLPTLAVFPTSAPTALPTRTPHVIPSDTPTLTPSVTPSPVPSSTPLFSAATSAPPTARPSLILDATLPISPDFLVSATPGQAAPSAALPPVLDYTPNANSAASATLPAAFIVGYSAGGRPITAHTFGTGAIIIMLVGGIHGGWEANTVALVQELIAHFSGSPADVLPGIMLLLIPTANPDGLVRGREISGRFNDNHVDLNRNWGCEWSPEAEWRDGPVNPGARAFSEPETQALALLIQQMRPAVVLFYHSAADGIFEGRCDNTTSSLAMATVLGEATGYRYGEPFTAYRVTGTAANWVDGQGIPSADVELTRWQSSEFARNLRGVMALQCWLSGASTAQYAACRQ